MRSAETTKVEIQEKRLKREAFCKKMWTDIEKKKKEIRKGAEKYKERLRNKQLGAEGKSNRQSQSRNIKLASEDK